VIATRLARAGLRGWHMQTLSMGAVLLCVILWIRAKTVDQDERGNSERRALFVGLWPPTLWLMGETLHRREVEPVPRRARRAASRLARARAR